MLDIILVAAAMYVCPGDVYTDVPRPGCRPLQESGKEGFSTIPEAPEFDSKSSVSTGEGGKSRRMSTPGFRPLQPKNARGTKNGSNFLRNRAASEHAIFHRPSSNDGPISSKSLATVRLPTAGNHFLLP